MRTNSRELPTYRDDNYERRTDYMPSLEEIRAACAAIRAEWADPATRKSRSGRLVPVVATPKAARIRLRNRKYTGD